MLGDVLIPIMIVGYVVTTTYILIDDRRRHEQQEKIDYDELGRMLEKYRAELEQTCRPDAEKPTDKI